jgi:hypothetical protein
VCVVLSNMILEVAAAALEVVRCRLVSLFVCLLISGLGLRRRTAGLFTRSPPIGQEPTAEPSLSIGRTKINWSNSSARTRMELAEIVVHHQLRLMIMQISLGDGRGDVCPGRQLFAEAPGTHL